MKETDVHNGAATVTMQSPAITAIPDVISQPQLTQAVPHTKERTTTRRKSQNDLYNKIGYSLAILASFGVAGLFWYIGAYYTLRGLTAFGLDVQSLTWWLLPIFITAVELWLMPKKGTAGFAVVMFFMILGFDVLTSWFGLINDLAGRNLPLGAGITLPTGGTVLHSLCIVLSLVFAFLPEKLGRWAYREITGTWL